MAVNSRQNMFPASAANLEMSFKRRTPMPKGEATMCLVGLEYDHGEAVPPIKWLLDKKNQLIADEILGQGTVDHARVYPREVARRALELSASSLILVHNHPSGDPTPSAADVDMTRQVEAALKPLLIAVHDHLVVGRDGTASLKALGLF